MEPGELEAVAIESRRTIDIDEFVPRKDIDELYIRDPYHIVTDGEVGQQAFAGIRDAIKKKGMVALGKVVFTSREHIIALEPRGKGMVGMSLRYPSRRNVNDFMVGPGEDQQISQLNYLRERCGGNCPVAPPKGISRAPARARVQITGNRWDLFTERLRV